MLLSDVIVNVVMFLKPSLSRDTQRACEGRSVMAFASHASVGVGGEQREALGTEVSKTGREPKLTDVAWEFATCYTELFSGMGA